MQITFNHVLDFCTCKISFVLHILKMWPIMFEFIWSRSQHLWLTVANRHTYQLHLIRRQEWVTLNWSKSFFFFFSFCWHCITSWHCQEMICRLYAFWLNKKKCFVCVFVMISYDSRWGMQRSLHFFFYLMEITVSEMV